jgi:hypothetical protein
MSCGCQNQEYNPCHICNPEPNCDPCSEPQACPINLDTSCIFYNLYEQTNDLPCLGFSNGTSLKLILEEIDERLCQNLPNIASYNLPCLRDSYVVTNFQQFSEAVDEELCLVRADLSLIISNLQTQVNGISTLLNSIYFPSVSDCGDLDINPTDSIIVVLQKYADALCDIKNNCCSDNSPVLNTVNTNSISLFTTGLKNHTLTASVKISAASNNLLQVLPDGLYCTVSVPNYIQVLSFDNITNTITLSNGGGSITLNTDLDNQLLTFNCGTKLLSISNGNTVDLSCLASGALTETPLVVVDTSSINFTTSGTNGHILTGNVSISPNAGNTLQDVGNGLFVATVTAPDEKLKLNSIDPTNGYLENKVAGKINSINTVLVTSNNTTHKLEIETVTNIANLLSEISSNPSFLTTFCNIVKSCICFKFRIKNTAHSSKTYNYVDCNGTLHSGLSLGAGVSVDVCGEKADSSDVEIEIYNLGFC